MNRTMGSSDNVRQARPDQIIIIIMSVLTVAVQTGFASYCTPASFPSSDILGALHFSMMFTVPLSCGSTMTKCYC